MGVRSICPEGYAVSICRCTKTHDPVKVVPCPHEGHGGPRYERADEALAHHAAPKKTCARCGEAFGEKDFRGDVCGWCADDLEGTQS